MILPTPSPSFRWDDHGAGPALVCRDLEPYARHLFTTRLWSLGSRSGHLTDDDRWAEVARAVQAPGRIARLRQVHGRHVVIAGASEDRLPEGDILITGNPSVPIAVQAADCVPLIIVDAATGVVAAAHAGWRGMAAGVPQTTVDALAREYGSRPRDLFAALGPSIGACCYEVGSDVRDAFIAGGIAAEHLDAWFHDEPVPSPANPTIIGPSGLKASVPARPSSSATASADRPSLRPGQSGGARHPETDRHTRQNGFRDGLRANAAAAVGAPVRPCHWFFDGWACVRWQLETAGVPRDRIFSAGLCTASHPDVFCSYRRDGAPTGRMAGVVICRHASACGSHRARDGEVSHSS
jgi:copper oxidase (laccase) domain-containing protein